MERRSWKCFIPRSSRSASSSDTTSVSPGEKRIKTRTARLQSLRSRSKRVLNFTLEIQLPEGQEGGGGEGRSERAGPQDPSCVKSGVKVRQSWRTRSTAGEFDQARSQCSRPPGSSGHFLLLSADMPDGDGKLLVQQDFFLLLTIKADRLNNCKNHCSRLV